MNAASKRPDVVHSRNVPGHWEGDLIIGALGGSAIATLVERTTRFVMLGHLGRERSAEAVRDSLVTTVQDLPLSLRGTLTWDQGAEMAEHHPNPTAARLSQPRRIPRANNCHHIEFHYRVQLSGTTPLLRPYFPKGTDPSIHSAEDLDWVSAELNNRPRKRLQFQKPIGAIGELLLQ